MTIKKTINLTSEMIMTINTAAKLDFESAQVMLKTLNMVLGTDFYFLNKRVVVDLDKPHDLWANLEI